MFYRESCTNRSVCLVFASRICGFILKSIFKVLECLGLILIYSRSDDGCVWVISLDLLDCVFCFIFFNYVDWFRILTCFLVHHAARRRDPLLGKCFPVMLSIYFYVSHMHIIWITYEVYHSVCIYALRWPTSFSISSFDMSKEHSPLCLLWVGSMTF